MQNTIIYIFHGTCVFIQFFKSIFNIYIHPNSRAPSPAFGLARAPAFNCHINHIAPAPFELSCWWWAHRGVIPCHFFGLHLTESPRCPPASPHPRPVIRVVPQ